LFILEVFAHDPVHEVPVTLCDLVISRTYVSWRPSSCAD